MKKTFLKKGNGGFAIGEIILFSAYKEPQKQTAENPAGEEKTFETAFARTQKAYNTQIDTAAQRGDEKAANILRAQCMMLEDEKFVSSVKSKIREGRFSAAYAVHIASEEAAAKLAGAESEYLRARTSDIKNVGRRIIAEITGEGTDLAFGKEAIIYAEDISPEEIIAFDKNRVKAIVTKAGSPLSHTSILAGTYSIPYLFGLERSLCPPSGTRVIVDGEAGIFIAGPDAETLAAYEKKILEFEAVSHEDDSDSPVGFYANIAGIDDLEPAQKNGAAGIGLFRTEFLFMNRDTLPTEEEQFIIYRQVAEKMGKREAIIRTMDIGTDKQTKCLVLPKEENPALGKRAIRICLSEPRLFREQLRALFRAAEYGNIKIMFPMIASAWELEEIKKELEIAAKELEEKGVSYKIPPCGIMIETPAAAICSDRLAKMADFFSIGTNDLTQYTLAADRRGEGMEKYFDSKHEAVFKLIEITVQNAHKNGIPVCVCGELGGDPEAIPRLIGLGVDKLSMSPGKIPQAKKAAKKYLSRQKIQEPLTAPADGLLIPMSEIPDKAFASGVLGECLAVDTDDGKIYAPCNGKVTFVAGTSHAITIESDLGTKILIHAGINTVTLNGQGFNCKVKAGGTVKQGELILEEDVSLIRKKGFSPMVIMAYGEKLEK